MIFDSHFFSYYPDFDFTNAKISPFGEGLINYSWLVTTPNSSQKFFLQKLNTAVFSNVEALENNLITAENFLKNQNFHLVFPLKNRDGKMHTNAENGVFRLYYFIENADTHQLPPSNDHIFSAAKKFAEFSKILTPVANNFEETIPDFHNLSLRYEDFQEILQKIPDDNPRKIFAKNEIESILSKKWIVEKFEKYKQKIPKRVYHHDAKMNNILFAKNSSQALFPVDLDTIMSGYIFSDFGDMVWSMVFGIDHGKPQKTHFDAEKYDALTRGYLSGFAGDISQDEIEAMHFGGIVMSFMLAIRFLADFLNGDKYFKTTYENQNFERAFWQLDIVEQLLNWTKTKKMK